MLKLGTQLIVHPRLQYCGHADLMNADNCAVIPHVVAPAKQELA